MGIADNFIALSQGGKAMQIKEKNGVFILDTENTQYVFSKDANGVLNHLHWGRKCKDSDYFMETQGEKNSNQSPLDFMKTEYVPYGGTAYRTEAISATYADGCRETVLTYDSYTITSDADRQCLEVQLSDKAYGLQVTLGYKITEGFDIIERYTKIKNTSDQTITLNKIASGEFNFPSQNSYISTNANGAWASEFRMMDTELKNGVLTYESRRGHSAHCNCPFFILSQNADENKGDVYFGALAWSGNFKIELSRDFKRTTRAVAGISDMDFSYTLKPGKEFITPSVFCGYTEGFAAMSNQMNRFSRTHILPKNFADQPLPVLYNSWEATEFDVNCADQLALAKIAAEIGCELFVMDDGWFGARNSDRAGLGDWFVNKEKFPDGLTPLIDGVKALGMKFGLWFEPEMVNPDSDLFRQHPDWAYHYDTRKGSLLRNQLELNMTRKDVQEYVFNCLDTMLTEYDISYIKWDMNRPMSETGAENLENPQELWVRHVQAVYAIVDKLKAKHPQVQIESCASGGGRAELGALGHYDMVWTSDNTDPVDRLDIQNGYSLLYPIKCMRAWVTDTNRKERPNDLDFRFNVSMQGSLSLGGNLHNYTPEEIEKSKAYVSLYKTIRSTVQFGDFYRLATYNKDGYYATQYTDDTQSVLFVCSPATSFFNDRYYTIRLNGLEPDADYTFTLDEKEITKSGSYLMYAGIPLELTKPFSSAILVFKKQ